MRLIPFALVAAGVIGCANAPSKSPVPSSTGASFDMFKNQVKQTAQAGSNLVQASAQDLQNSVQSQMSQIDNQQRALQAQLNSTAGETRAALERRLQDVQTQKQAILTRMSDAQRSGAAGLDSTGARSLPGRSRPANSLRRVADTPANDRSVGVTSMWLDRARHVCPPRTSGWTTRNGMWVDSS